MSYPKFLERKRIGVEPVGFEIGDDLNPMLFEFQRDIVRWAIRRGRAAIFADCGLGKTPMQLEWARHVCAHTKKPVLILAPLAVNHQTQREGDKFGIPVTVCRDQTDIRPGINIANYEMLGHFTAGALGGIVLDESSILKAFNGKTRRLLTDFASSIQFRLCCTATPAPNDTIELINHSAFLDIMSGKEVLALFFIQDGNTTHKWKLKGHATGPFWEWMAKWAVALRHPKDLGYQDDGFTLPSLNIHELVVPHNKPMDGFLFPMDASTLEERRQARRKTVNERCRLIADQINDSTTPWIIWCNLNIESETAAKMIEGAVEVRGSDSLEHKERAMRGFSAGEIRVLVSKPRISGFGMNWQHCHKVVFLGLSDSYEQFYQAIRRCWRFGQLHPVHCHVVTSSIEGKVVQNIKRKERQAGELMDQIVKRMSVVSDLSKAAKKDSAAYVEDTTSGNGWRMWTGDAIDLTKRIDAGAIGLTVFSPPFPGMYAYTNSDRDVGNCKNIDELVNHFGFLVPDLLRITMPGRLCCIHLTQEPMFKYDSGAIGLRDFRGKMIETMQVNGWIYFGEITIDKNPQLKASRTKDSTLLFKTLSSDSAGCRMALADYLLVFKKPGENPRPIKSGHHKRWNPHAGWITPDEWIEWAAPVWYRKTADYPGGIKETDVIDQRPDKDTEDTKHLCPLQLGVIERVIKLWSIPGDVVFSPFAGIGSEGYMAVKLGRDFLGIELKPTYAKAAARNLRRAERDRELPMLRLGMTPDEES